jgi:hypothetical protein
MGGGNDLHGLKQPALFNGVSHDNSMISPRAQTKFSRKFKGGRI